MLVQKSELHLQSHHLNPMDYSDWDSLAEKVYVWKMKKFTEQELKDKIKEKWVKISVAEIYKSIFFLKRF